MDVNEISLKTDGWTPALITMASNFMDELLSRPAVALIINAQNNCGKDYYKNLKKKIENKKYQSVTSWIDDLLYPLNSQSKDLFVAAASQDLLQWINKNVQPIHELARFQFKNALIRVTNELKQANEMPIEIQPSTDEME